MNLMIVPGMFVCSRFLISSSPVSAITERRGMGLYEVPLSMSLLSFWMGTMLAYFHMRGIILVLRAVFNMLVRNATPRRPMCLGA